MINYQFGDIDAYRAAVRPPPPRGGQSARRFWPTWVPLADFGLVAGRQKFDTQLRRDLQVIDEDPNRQHKGGQMSFVTAQPGLLTAAAGNLTGIGSAMNAENSAEAAPTTGVVPAAGDEVSALSAARFAVHAQMCQVISAQAAAVHETFVNTPGTSAGSYAATEAANAVAAT